MRRDPEYAREMLHPIEYLRPALDIPLCHHEKWDGSGYPRGLKGEGIPLPARMFAVVDIWDAIRSDRPYRAAWPDQRARDHIASLAGSHLDAHVIDAFFKLLRSLDGQSQAATRGIEGAAGSTRRRILVVDDYRPSVELVRRWLTADGYDVATANTGQAALDAVARQRPDLVLLDIVIPEPDGLTVCRRLKEDPATSGIPVVFMSGLDPATTGASAPSGRPTT